MTTTFGIWTRRETNTELKVRIIERITGFNGEARFRVCKAEADPRYTFTVRIEDVVLL